MLLTEQAYKKIDRELAKFPADQRQSAVMAALAIATVGEVRGGDPDGVRGGVVGHAHFRFTGLFASLDWLAGPASEARRMSSTT